MSYGALNPLKSWAGVIAQWIFPHFHVHELDTSVSISLVFLLLQLLMLLPAPILGEYLYITFTVILFFVLFCFLFLPRYLFFSFFFVLCWGRHAMSLNETWNDWSLTIKYTSYIVSTSKLLVLDRACETEYNTRPILLWK